MNDAAGRLIGGHDFAAFGAPPQGDVTIRRVIQAEWRIEANRWPELVFTIEANAFLYRMVRRIVKALTQVGFGRLSAEDVSDILASKDPQRVKGMAPACGLCLVKVTY
jgi:tRNA pseudouridine38-40 synthase